MKYSRTFTPASLNQVKDVLPLLLERGAWFEVTPFPEDAFEVTVKAEHAAFLDSLA